MEEKPKSIDGVVDKNIAGKKANFGVLFGAADSMAAILSPFANINKIGDSSFDFMKLHASSLYDVQKNLEKQYGNDLFETKEFKRGYGLGTLFGMSMPSLLIYTILFL
jgi:hypothetical protein